MTNSEAFIEGFIKRAHEKGIPQHNAQILLKLALEKEAGFMGDTWTNLKDNVDLGYHKYFRDSAPVHGINGVLSAVTGGKFNAGYAASQRNAALGINDSYLDQFHHRLDQGDTGRSFQGDRGFIDKIQRNILNNSDRFSGDGVDNDASIKAMQRFQNGIEHYDAMDKAQAQNSADARVVQSKWHTIGDTPLSQRTQTPPVQRSVPIVSHFNPNPNISPDISNSTAVNTGTYLGEPKRLFPSVRPQTVNPGNRPGSQPAYRPNSAGGPIPNQPNNNPALRQRTRPTYSDEGPLQAPALGVPGLM